MKPVLATKEMSRGHLEVLKLMLGIIDASLLNSKPVQKDLEDELFQAFSSGAFKLTDGRRFVSPLSGMCGAAYILNVGICCMTRNFPQVAVDDMCKAVKCFVTVVQVGVRPCLLVFVVRL
jgi:hypothetical protein